MAKCMCGCLFCMICGGPILLIVGIVILATPNTREDDVNEYNAIVAAYNTTDSDDWNGGTIAGSTISLQTDSVTVSGSTEDVDDALSRYARVSVSNPPSSVSYAVNNIAPFTRSVTYSVTRTVSGDCPNSRCYNGNGVCPSYATYSGPSSCDEGTCGTCTYTDYVNKFCQVVKKSGSQWVDDPNTKCFYKNDAKYTTSSTTTVEFQVRQSGDPYVALQRITEGDDDFGITQSQQNAAGVILIVIGCIMIACICVVVFIIYKLVKKYIVKDDDPSPHQQSNDNHGSNNNNHGSNNNNHGSYNNNNNHGSYNNNYNGQEMAEPTNQGVPVYGQPVGYGYGQPPPTQQQQPPYNQQAPQYGNPAPPTYQQQNNPQYYNTSGYPPQKAGGGGPQV